MVNAPQVPGREENFDGVFGSLHDCQLRMLYNKFHGSRKNEEAIKLRVSAIKNVLTFLAVAIKLNAVRFIQSL
jgi:hypothetical protein